MATYAQVLPLLFKVLVLLIILTMIDQSERGFHASGIIKKIYSSKKLMALTFTVAFAVVGTVTLLLTRAAAPSSSVELESGTLTPPAVVGSDTNASGSKYVQYSTIVSTPPPSPTPSPTGTSYYVDCNGGSDSNAGTSQTTAWKTLGKANAAALASGNGLLFKRGCNFGSGLTVKWSGVTVGNYGSGALPIFSTTSTGGNIVSVSGSGNTVDGLEVDGPDTVTASSSGPRGGIAGISVEPGASNNTIQNSTITGNYAGIFVRQDAANNRILHNIIKDNKLLDTSGGAGAFGILMWGHNNQVSYNSFSGNFADSALYPPYDGSSVEIYTSNGNTAASNNTMSYNTSVNDNAFSELGKGNTAAIPDNNIFAYNSYVASGQGNALFVNTRGTSADGYGPITNTKVYNNSVYITGANKAAALICQGTCSASALVYQNNILISSAGGTSVGGASGSNNITTAADAAYVNAPGDLHLQSSSKAINAGNNTALSAGFNKDLDGHGVPAGSAVDIGAYEFGSVVRTQGSSNIVASILHQIVKTSGQIFANIGRFFGSAMHMLGSIFSSGHAVAAVSADATATAPCVGSPAPAQWKHVVVLMFENHQYNQVIGSPDAPYITSLANACSSSKSWYDADFKSPGVKDGSYISKPNYFTLTSGLSPSQDTGSVGGGGDSSSTRTTVDNIYRQLRHAGKSYMDYYNASGTGCGVGYSGNYHDAVRYYNGDGGLDASTCNAHDVSLSTFMTDVNSGNLPAYSMILPTNCDNMHSCSGISNVVVNGDNWAKNFLPQFFNSAQYKSGDTAFFFVWDEDTNIPNVLAAPSIKAGSAAPATSHFGALRTMTEMLGLPYLGVTNAAVHQSEDLLSFFNGGGTTPNPNPTPPPTDTTAPTVSITAPAASATLNGIVNVTATASDNVGVQKVEFYVDGALKATDTSSPYNFSLDTTTLANSGHTLKAIAYDTATTPNQTSSTPVTVTVNNSCAAVAAPFGMVTVPVNVPQAGTYRIWSRIMAPDTTNNSYTFQTDGVCGLTIGDSAVAANSWTWVNYKNGGPTTPADVTLAAGSHTLLLAGREVGVKLDRVILLLSTDSCVPTGTGDNCTTAPDSTPPTVSISAPTNGSTTKSPVTVTATASDAGGSGLDRVEFSVDDVLQNTILGLGPFNWTWSTTATGNHKLSAKAFDKAGNASTVSSVNVTVQDTTKPTVSINTPATGATVSSSQVAVTTSATDNVGVTSLSLMIDNASTPYQTLVGNTTGTYGFTWDASNVTSGNHVLQVQAKDAAGNVGISANVTVTVSNDKTPPSQPTNLSATVVSATQVNLSWTGSTDNTGVTGYIIQRDGANVAQITGTTYSDATAAATQYSYAVIAKDAASNLSQPSNTVQATTPAVSSDNTPPTAPQNLQAQAINNNQVNLSWDASTDTGGSGLKGYYVLRNGQKIATVATLTFSDGTTQASTNYTYSVEAFDGAGNVSSPSNQVSTPTPTPTPTSDTTAPTATINSPTPGQTVSAQSNVSANINDNIGVARAVLLVDGTQRAQILNPGQGNITLRWQTNVVPDGSHTLLVIVIDGAGNVGGSDAVTLTVQNNKTPAPGSTTTHTFSVVADAGLKKSRPTTNFGTARSMSVDSRPKEKMVMKFNVTGITGKVTKAVIRLYDVNGSNHGGSFYNISNNWSEKKITWNNAPYFYNHSPVARLGKVKKNTYVEIPVTGIVKTNGTYSFGGRSYSSDGADYSTKEDSSSSRRPQLIITEGATSEKFNDED